MTSRDEHLEQVCHKPNANALLTAARMGTQVTSAMAEDALREAVDHFHQPDDKGRPNPGVKLAAPKPLNEQRPGPSPSPPSPPATTPPPAQAAPKPIVPPPPGIGPRT